MILLINKFNLYLIMFYYESIPNQKNYKIKFISIKPKKLTKKIKVIDFDIIKKKSSHKKKMIRKTW